MLFCSVKLYLVACKLSLLICVSQNGEVDPALKALEDRQDEVLRRLYELKATVDGLTKTVTTPDADLDSTTLSHATAESVFRGTADLDSLLGKVSLTFAIFLFILSYIMMVQPYSYIFSNMLPSPLNQSKHANPVNLVVIFCCMFLFCFCFGSHKLGWTLWQKSCLCFI